MSEKEPGQIAYEEWSGSQDIWGYCSSAHKEKWATVETAIRADEATKVRAKTIEECAKVAEAMIDKDAADLGDRSDMALMDAAAAIRALGEKP